MGSAVHDGAKMRDEQAQWLFLRFGSQSPLTQLMRDRDCGKEICAPARAVPVGVLGEAAQQRPVGAPLAASLESTVVFTCTEAKLKYPQ